LKLRIIHAKGEEGFPSKIGDPIWSGIRSFSDSEDQTVRKTLFIGVRPDGLRNLAVFDSELDHYDQIERKYCFRVVTLPKILQGQDLMVHLMSSKREKDAAVELVEKYGVYPLDDSAESQSDRSTFLKRLVNRISRWIAAMTGRRV